MILFSHIVAGSVVSTAPLDPVVLVVLAISIHFLLDAVPHAQAGLLHGDPCD